MVRLSPSIMCADLLNLEREIVTLERAGVEFFHVDVMDGHFVRNFGLPYDLVRAVKRITAVPLDVHLAVDNPRGPRARSPPTRAPTSSRSTPMRRRTSPGSSERSGRGGSARASPFHPTFPSRRCTPFWHRPTEERISSTCSW